MTTDRPKTMTPATVVGKVYLDHDFRRLRVDACVPADPAGREIRGTLVEEDGTEIGEYATSVAIFREVWVERERPRTRQEQELTRRRLAL